MFDDDNLNLYGYVLVLSGVIFGASFFAPEPRVEVAGISLEAADTGAIETASIPLANSPEGAQDWNYPVIPWRSYEDGMQEMAKSNKPAVLVLQADWCLVCRNYQRLFDEPEVEKWANDYVFILGDIEKQPELQRRYNVDGDYIPRTFVLDPDGGLRTDASGSHERQRFFVDPYKPGELSTLLEAQR